MKQSSYSRDFNTVADTDEDRDTCIPRFYTEAEEYTVDGVKHWREREMVEVLIPGDSLKKPVHYVTEFDLKRWPKAYKAFKDNLETPVSGTPLEQWPALNKSMVLRLKSLNFRSVEDVSRMSEHAMREVGISGRKLQQSALAYIDGAQRNAITEMALADAERFKALAEETKAQNKRLNEALELLNSRLQYMEQNQQFAVQNGASTPQVHTPAVPRQVVEDPFAAFAGIEERQTTRRDELAAFNHSEGPSAPPDLPQANVDLQIPAKRRGRPPKAQANG